MQLKINRDNMENLKETQQTNVVTEKVTIKEVKNTPFNLIKRKGDKWRIVIGNSFATKKKFYTSLGAKLYIYSKPYDLVGTMFYFITNNFK